MALGWHCTSLIVLRIHYSDLAEIVTAQLWNPVQLEVVHELYVSAVAYVTVAGSRCDWGRTSHSALHLPYVISSDYAVMRKWVHYNVLYYII